MARTLGVDYGSRRVGVAVSDEAGLIALPLTVLAHEGPRQVIDRLLALCAEKNAAAIVVGWPLAMDGTRGPAAQHVEQFVERLRARTDLPVALWDERLSSRQAERALLEADLSRARRRQVVDQTAARLMLQSYLDAHAPPSDPADAGATPLPPAAGL